MKKIFDNPGELEKLAKNGLSIPPFLMMENAARSMADFIIKKNVKKIIILCGKGNNGGDGFALARLLSAKNFVFKDEDFKNIELKPVLLIPQLLNEKSPEEAKTQFEICKKLNIPMKFGKEILPFLESTFQNETEIKNETAIVDCLFGIGFHGKLSEEYKLILDKINSVCALKIACDVPSALYFNADFTITMGTHKTFFLVTAQKTFVAK